MGVVKARVCGTVFVFVFAIMDVRVGRVWRECMDEELTALCAWRCAVCVGRNAPSMHAASVMQARVMLRLSC